MFNVLQYTLMLQYNYFKDVTAYLEIYEEIAIPKISGATSIRRDLSPGGAESPIALVCDRMTWGQV